MNLFVDTSVWSLALRRDACNDRHIGGHGSPPCNPRRRASDLRLMESMLFVRWTRAEAEFPPELDTVLTEIGPDGVVKREIGVDLSGHAISRKPSMFGKHGCDGLFYRIDLPPLGVEIEAEEFERLWREG